MAGFTLRGLNEKPSSFIDNIQKNIRKLSLLGMRWDDSIIKQSKSIGITEAIEDSMYSMYYQGNIYTGTDIGNKEFIAFFDREYSGGRRDFIRRFAQNAEIEHVLEVISDKSNNT